MKLGREFSKGFESELAYWDTELSLKGHYPDAILDRLQPERMKNTFPAMLTPYLDEIRACRGCAPAVLDVGSGPLSMLVYGARAGEFELTCADPLADHYDRLLRKYGYAPNSVLVRCFGEQLSASFGSGAFDLVWIHNALDHTQSPAAVFREMTLVLRPGGYLVLQGWSREGGAEGYIGLHQHDIYIAHDGRLMCETRTARGTVACCLTAGLPLVTVDSSEPTDSVKQWVRVIFRKI